MKHFKLSYVLLILSRTRNTAEFKFFTSLLFLLFIPSIIPGQIKSTNEHVRPNMPATKPSEFSTAPGYCPSSGGSRTFESIQSVDVIEKSGNKLEITVNIYIANPTKCQPNSPCPVYTANPENVHVWIDWNGKNGWEPQEMVLNEKLNNYYQNYGGTLTARKIVDIPENAVRPTWLRANLGWGADPEDPCLASWSFGDVSDQQIFWSLKVTEIAATQAIKMKDVGDKLWSASYDKDGNILYSNRNDPLAVSAMSGSVSLPVKLSSFPDNIKENFKTVCEYQIKAQGFDMHGNSEFKGKEGILKISVPNRIGFYDIHMNFKFYGNENNLLGSDLFIFPLWVSFEKPKLPEIKKLWLHKAIEWTEGTMIAPNTSDELAEKMMNGIYTKGGWKWKYLAITFSWDKLIEGKETDGGDCSVMAYTWINLLKTLGVGDVSLARHTGRKYGNGFLSVPGFVAFGGLPSANGNAIRTGAGSYDRWVFAAHTFGKKGGLFYDPVFNVTSTDKYFHVAGDLKTELGKSWETDDGATIIQFGTFSLDEGHWKKYSYTYVLDKKGSVTGSTSTLSLNASFSGEYSEKMINPDGDAYINQLGADVGVDISLPDTYTVSGILLKGDSVITTQPFFSSSGSWYEQIGPATGRFTVHPVFSGERILQKKLGGIYKIKLFIIDSNGNLADTVTFTTQSHSFSEFGELPVRIGQITEQAQDTDNDGILEGISENIFILNSIPGEYTIQMILSKDMVSLASDIVKVNLKAGENHITQMINGKVIAASGVDGPYTLSVNFCDKDAVQIAENELQTSAYKSTQFTPPSVRQSGMFTEDTTDTNNNGLIDTLLISLNLNSEIDDTCVVIAYLVNQEERFITATETVLNIIKGENSLKLKFDGRDINKSTMDGPYKIAYLLVKDSKMNNLFSAFNLFTTSNYTYQQFETARSLLVTATGSYLENIMDNDSDGLFDTLMIDIGITVADSGSIVAMGRLADADGETIAWSSSMQFMKSGTIGSIPLKFDGRYIYGSLQNGPYELKDLQIYHVGYPDETIEITDAHKTWAYSYTDFEQAGVVTGSVFDSLGNPLPGIRLSVNNNTFDYSNLKGKYGLTILEEGEYELEITGPDSIDYKWQITLNDSSFEGNKVHISVSQESIIQINFRTPAVLTSIENNSSAAVPVSYLLMQNYPNPFNPTTIIRYAIPEAGRVVLEIYDILGKKIATLLDEYQTAGIHEKVLSAEGISSGVLFYRLKSGSFIQTKRMILVK